MASEGIPLPGSDRIAWRSPAANILIVLISCGLLVWAWRFLQSRAGTVVSVDAVVNGKLIDIRTPEAGQIESLEIQTGDAVASGSQLLVVQNPRTSQLPLQALTSRLNQYRADLARVEDQLARQRSLKQLAAVDQSNQQVLEVAEVAQQVQRLKADLAGAKSRQKLALTQRDRLQQLFQQGAIARANLEVAEADWQQRTSDVNSLIAQINTLEVNRSAVSAGLSLAKTRSNYDPRIRLQEVTQRIAEIESEKSSWQQRIRDVKAEIAQARRDVQQKQLVQLKAPVDGVVWKLDAQAGKYLQPGETIGQIADCRQRWVDAIVDEASVRSLQVGMPAQMQLNGAAQDVRLRGKIAMIRSGLGRRNLGDDVTVPLSTNQPRQAQVRVALDPSIQTAQAESHGNLCYIGYTGRVSFTLQPPENPAWLTVLRDMPQKITALVSRS